MPSSAQHSDKLVADVHAPATPLKSGRLPASCDQRAAAPHSAVAQSQPMAFSPVLQLPAPDSNGATVGIPMPLQGMRRSSGASTLPPMPAASVQAPAHAPAADVPLCGSSPLQNSAISAAGVSAAGSHKPGNGGAQYCQVLVPTTVYQNGVTRQLLVPMMCMVAPNTGLGGSPPRCAPITAGALQPRTPNNSNAPSPGKQAPARQSQPRLRAKASRESSPLGVAHTTVYKKAQPSRSASRGSGLSSGAVSHLSEQRLAEVRKDENGALDVLADAAMLELP